MKKIKYITTIALILLSLSIMGQALGPGDPGGSPGVDEDPIGGGAPIGGGGLILIGMAAVYGGRKFYLFNKNKEELED